MKQKGPKLRLSPNEEARVIREEQERRRKLRIQQVREQQRYIALQIRREVEQKRQQELQQLEEELRHQWEKQQREKLQTLQRLYQESLQLLGQGHRSAKENEPDLAAIAQREEENHFKAEERYREALKELKSQRLRDREQQNASINARKKALQAEKERSTKVASLPPPPPNPLQDINTKRPCVVRRSDVSAYSGTHYHMPESAVDREVDTLQPNANDEAELEARRQQDWQREEKRRREEQLEKARLRGIEALRREQLVQDRERLLVELEHMQQTDLLRRRQQVTQMPPQIFQPLYQRKEAREDFQREMEFAFEDMYTGERRIKGDLVVRLEPEPLPALSTGSQDQALDVTLDENTTPETENILHDAEQEVSRTEQETSAEVAPSRPAPRQALRKLLDRIRSQRNQWTDHSRNIQNIPPADSPPAATHQIPERDSSIETGSLVSEREKQSPSEPPEPVAAPLVATMKPPAPLEAPDVLASRIREFEEERRKREEQLEREKQQQVLLLKDLEEQKAVLELMLLEAQQEREELKAAVSQEAPSKQPEDPAEEDEISSALQAELVPPPDEDNHTRRVKEYQQRLLEQNKVHQRSVEVARRRLEEYQRALRIRYITAGSSQPPILPSGLVHPPPPSTQPAHLLPPFYLPADIHYKPPTSEEDATKVSDMPASPPRLPQEGFVSGSPDVTTWLTDSIMERVTDHLPERLRPSPVTTETHRPSTTLRSPNVPSQTDPEHLQDISPLIPQHDVPPQSSPHTSLLRSRADDIERQRRELEDLRTRRLEQREAAMQQQRQEEEERRRLEVERRKQLEEEERQRQESELEQIRKQKERLQALISMDAQPVSEPSSDVSVSENLGQNRVRLLASLLRAIEESHGGTLSHLEEPPERENSPPQLPSLSTEPASVAQSSVPAPPPPPGPPQALLLHPPRAVKPPVSRVWLGFSEMTQQHELSAIPEVETPVNRSQLTGLEESLRLRPSLTAAELEDSETSVLEETAASSEKSSERSSHRTWRERLLTGAGTQTQSSDCSTERNDSFLRIMSPLSSDSGRGADVSGAVITSYRAFTESPLRPQESDCLSSTTISTGSYVTTDPEQIPACDKSTSLQQCAQERNEADLLEASSPLAPDLSVKGSPAAEPHDAAIDSLFNDSSIQRIIDKYTRQLNVSLSAAGRTTDSEGSLMDELDFSVSQPSLVRVSESRDEDEETTASSRSGQTDPAAAQKNDPHDVAVAVTPSLQRFSAVDPSLVEAHEDSFRPLIGQLADESSCLVADHRDSAMEQLVGQPSAQSSMIGSPPGPQVGWDSTLRRMMGRLSHQSGSDWLIGGRDPYEARLARSATLEPSGAWLGEVEEEESGMRPLVGEPDESAGQISGSSGERSHLALTASSPPTFPPQISSRSTSDPPVNPQQEETRAEQQDSLRAGGSDSFHWLTAEVTHNETADPSMTFHRPEISPEGRPASGGTPASSSPSAESEPSPERLRTAEPDLLHQSDLSLTDVEQTVVNLTDTNVHHDSPAPSTSALGGNCDPPPVLLSDANLKGLHDSLSRRISEAAGEKGILEQSEITLLSLTDTTLQDQETLVTEEEEEVEVQEYETKGSEYSSPTEDCRKTHRATTLEFQWGPNTDVKEQQKLKALLQRSDLRVEELKARRAQSKTPPDGKTPPDSRTPPVAWKATTSSEPQSQTTSKSDVGQEKPGPTQQKKPQFHPPVRDSRVNEVDEVKICTPEQRRRNLSQMHRRTQRLYEQLEEVKQQKAARSRREDYANNRLKAKEFHKKTLQKLRAKQTRP